MKNIIFAAAALALVVPSMASATPAPAAPAAAAKVLSVKASALQPRRAPVKGERLSGDTSTAVLVGVGVAVVVGGALLLSSGGDSR